MFRLDFTFWLGIPIGLGIAFVFWYITTKVLTSQLSVSESLVKLTGPDSKRTYRFSLKNDGRRDAVDVRVKCNLFSTGWAQGPPDEIATIDVPVSVGQIDVMPGRRFWFLPARPIDNVGDRIVTLQLAAISDLQKGKLPREDRARLESGELGLEEMLDLGEQSFINVVVYGFDRFSGSRTVYADRYYKKKDIG